MAAGGRKSSGSRGYRNNIVTVAVVVMGDLARSPRMLNHARELAANGFTVVLIGYRGRNFEPPTGVRVCALEGGRSAPSDSSGLSFAVTAGMRMSRLFFALFRALVREKPRAIVLQNPPAFPTLTAGKLAAKWLGARVLVDWHNYGFSLLAVRLGSSHWLVRLARRYEFRAARGAYRHFCVSAAMREDLRRHGIGAEVLYDRPWCTPSAAPEQFVRLLAVCPAGWTADEDIELLLDALDLLPRTGITVCITGDGPRRRELAPRLAALRARGILEDTGFLPEPEYWNLLTRAHLGLSVHRSSSGLDLAMKVVDLFGIGAPVAALDYGGAIGEQIEEGKTGFLFRTAAELAALLTQSAAGTAALDAMRCEIRARWPLSWNSEWKRVALPAFEELT
jgi:beta-1,4-mannosyltransferase